MTTNKHDTISKSSSAESSYSIRIEEVDLGGNRPIPPVSQMTENLKKYEASARTLTNEQIEKIVLSIASGKNSYKDICEAVPEINSATVQDYLKNTPPPDSKTRIVCSNYLIDNPHKKSIIEFDKVPEQYALMYEFQDTDTFKLTVDGENIRYRLGKEQTAKNEALRMEENASLRHVETMRWNKMVFWATVIAILISAVPVIKDLLK